MKRSVLLSLLALIAVAVGAPLIGSTHVSLTRALAGISPDHEILFYARLPRVLLALLAGAALSVTGVLFQCMLRDPLAEPYTLGVSSGSSVGTVLAISLGFRASPLAAVAGAAVVLLIVLGMAMEGRRLSSFTLLLTGVTMNSISFAIILFLHSVASFSQSFAISRWLMGGLDAVEYSTLAWLAAAVIPICALITMRAPEWNLLAVGEDWATSRGVPASRLTTYGYIAGSILVGPGHFADRAHRVCGIDRPARAAIEAGRGSSRAAALRLSLRRGVSRNLRRRFANRDSADGDSRGSRNRAVRRTVLSLAAADSQEEPVAIILIGGGSRSGKSRFALERARREGSNLVFIATAEARDEEMRERIARHRAERGDEFRTVEAPLDLAGAIRASDGEAIVVDCLTLWLANTMASEFASPRRGRAIQPSMCDPGDQ